MSKGIRKLPIIQDAPPNWWVLKIADGVGTHTYSLKSMKTYAKYKVLMLKEEGNTSHVCQSYDQYDAKKYKYIFWYENSILCSWIPVTRGVLKLPCVASTAT